MGQIFYWTGVVFWSAIGILAVALLFIALHYWYDREISPSLQQTFCTFSHEAPFV